MGVLAHFFRCPDVLPTVVAMRCLRAEILAEAEPLAGHWLSAIADPKFAASAANLAHFLALRQRDVTLLQRELSQLGLSSLGRCSSRVRANLDAVLASLELIAGVEATCEHPPPNAHSVGEELLRERTEHLFGADPGGPTTRIMVTLDETAACDVDEYGELIAAGADVARLNAAHGDVDLWSEMAATWRAAAQRQGRSTVVQIDLSGPKCRIVSVDGQRSKRLRKGHRFILRHPEVTAPSSWEDGARASAVPAFPELLEQLQPGQVVHYDDGKLHAIVLGSLPGAALLEVREACDEGVRLREEKGLNFPDVELELPILGPDDEAALDFAAREADVVGLSFVQRPEDIVEVQRRLAERLGDRPLPGFVLKIETRLAVRNLPRLIVQAGGRQPVGVMIARGDLALEIGFERLAEVQEEIVELCRAAHVPVVWATQVLEGLVKEHMPTRAETSDASLAQQAQCVMLNKGPHQVDAVRLLDGILRRIDRLWSGGAQRLSVIEAWGAPQAVVPLTAPWR